MTIRYFYTQIIIYLILIIIFSGLVVYMFMQTSQIPLIVFVVLIIIFLSSKILLNFQKLIQKISYFFNAVENNDSTLYYSENSRSKSLNELHKSLNRVNELIKEAKLMNREQEQYFSVILEQLATGIVVINERGNILQANSAAKHLLKYETLTHILQLKKVNEKLYKAFTGLTDGKNDLVEFMHNNASVQLSLRAVNFEVRKDTLTIVAIQDISKELDNKEVATWIKLIRVLTHEIMNSITPITSLSDTLMSFYQNKDAEISVKTRENTLTGLKVIKERGEGLIKFVNSYRKLTGIQKPVLKSIELKSFIEHIIVLLSSDCERLISFEPFIAPDDLTLQADEAQISQVLINLIKNAIQAVQNAEMPTIKITAIQNEQKNIIISVEDNGKGIPDELIEQIFIPFFTTKETGSGIGLSISRQIMFNHGGNINVISKPDEGSRFVLEF